MGVTPSFDAIDDGDMDKPSAVHSCIEQLMSSTIRFIPQ